MIFISERILYIWTSQNPILLETIFGTSFQSLEYTLLVILGISFVLKLSYQIFYFRRTKTNINCKTKQENIPVSIVICTKNQDYLLEKYLPKFLEQDYPEFEVVVVDDGSSDGTENTLLRFKNQYKNLRSTKIPIDDIFKHNKKLALTIGIKSAKYEQLIFTNPNCYPLSKHWINNTMEKANGLIYSAYSNFEYQKGFVQNFIRYDVFKQAIKTSAFTSINKVFAGNGNNMSFEKSKFFADKGFAGHSHFEAGYDHILTHTLAKKTTAIYSLNPAIKLSIYSKNPTKEWSLLNSNYYKSRKFIPRKTRFLIDLEMINQLAFFSIVISMLIFTKLYLISIIISLVEIIISGYFLKMATTDLREENLFLSSYVYAFIWPVIKLSFYIKNLIFSK